MRCFGTSSTRISVFVQIHIRTVMSVWIQYVIMVLPGKTRSTGCGHIISNSQAGSWFFVCVGSLCSLHGMGYIFPNPVQAGRLQFVAKTMQLQQYAPLFLYICNLIPCSSGQPPFEGSRGSALVRYNSNSLFNQFIKARVIC